MAVTVSRHCVQSVCYIYCQCAVSLLYVLSVCSQSAIRTVCMQSVCYTYCLHAVSLLYVLSVCSQSAIRTVCVQPVCYMYCLCAVWSALCCYSQMFKICCALQKEQRTKKYNQTAICVVTDNNHARGVLCLT
jgi:hypothetical protein